MIFNHANIEQIKPLSVVVVSTVAVVGNFVVCKVMEIRKEFQRLSSSPITAIRRARSPVNRSRTLERNGC